MGPDGPAADLLPRSPVAGLLPAGASEEAGWSANANNVWRYIVRPIAVGGMLVGAAYTLFRMRNSLSAGLGRAFAELKQGGAAKNAGRTEQYMSSKTVFSWIAVTTILMSFLYIYFSGQVLGGIVATLVMLIAGFFFATVSGSLVGFIGSSNNPISGLTLSTVIIAALVDGGARRVRHFRRRCDPRCRGGRLRILRCRRRAAAGLQGRLHPRRHAANDSDCRA